MKVRSVTTVDWLKTGLYILLMIVITVVAAILLSELGLVGIVLWAAIFAGSLFLLVRWHAHSTAYRCPSCAEVFTISTLTDLISPQVPQGKYLTCPGCGKRSWATILMRDDA